MKRPKLYLNGLLTRLNFYIPDSEKVKKQKEKEIEGLFEDRSSCADLMKCMYAMTAGIYH